MDDEDRKKLRSNRVRLVKNLNVDEMLLSILSEDNILTESMCQEIEAINEKQMIKRAGTLLDILVRRGPKAFQIFIESLMITKQEDLAELLDEKLASEWRRNNKILEKNSKAKDIGSGESSILYNRTVVDYEATIISVDIQPVDQHDQIFRGNIKNYQHVYQLSKNPRGRALIISNWLFHPASKVKERIGAEYDNLNITSFLDKLHFITKLHTNLSAGEMKRVILREATDLDHHAAEVFICFVMTHGSVGKVLGIDGHSVDINDDIVRPFYASNCRALIHKPKIFFIQACQVPNADLNGSLSRGQVSAPYAEKLTEPFQRLGLNEPDSVPFSSTVAEHECADILVASATVQNYQAFRNTELGSWFVRSIIKIFSEHAYNEDILSLLTKVRSDVIQMHKRDGLYEVERKSQLTETRDTLTKKLFFFPGYVKDT